MRSPTTQFLAAEWLDERGDPATIILRVLIVVLTILLLVPGFIWWERRLLSWMQDRIGPNRVATFTIPPNARWAPKFLRGRKIRLWGLLQPIADGVKLFFKEDITPANIDRAIYFIAPAIALFPAFALGAVVPWASPDGPARLLTPIADVPIGVLYLIAISSLGVYGVVLAGYASNNKYSLMGGLRSSAQLISYELAMGMSLATIALATGSLMMTDMVRAQEGALWGAEIIDLGFVRFVNPFQNWFILTPFGFIAAVIFLICMVAETNRAPFDLPEAENELIAGYHTEYSSMKFAVFFMGEYAAMFIFSGVFAAVFLGGYNMLPIRFDAIGQAWPYAQGIFWGLSWANQWLAPLWFVGKALFGITVYIWLRATLPRLRYDQLMNLGWKSLLPLGLFNFIALACWLVLADSRVTGAAAKWWSAGTWVIALLLLVLILRAVRAGRRVDPLQERKVRLVDPEPLSLSASEAGTRLSAELGGLR